MPNTDALQASINKSLAAAAEMQGEWVKLLPPDKVEQLHDLLQKSMSVGVLIVNGVPPRIQFVAVDAAGGFVALEEVECVIAARH